MDLLIPVQVGFLPTTVTTLFNLVLVGRFKSYSINSYNYAIRLDDNGYF